MTFKIVGPAEAEDSFEEAEMTQFRPAMAAPKPAAAPAPAAKPAFDIARFAGIFAAIGLALGAIGTAFAAVVGGFLALKWWQMPLALVGVMLLLSGPAMVLAWFKLRRRNLAPLLDANGWAVNTQARISIGFGTELTRIAELPEGAERSLRDPYAPKAPVWPWLLLAVAVAVAWWAWRQGLLHT
jgi:MFS family permease